MDYIDNPFERTGQEVYGEDFIGRTEITQNILRYLTNRRGGRHVAIRGITRIGKSSLLRQILVVNRELILESKGLPILVNIARCQTGEDVFTRIVDECMKQLRILGQESAELTERVNLVSTPTQWHVKITAIQGLFQFVRNVLGWRPIVGIDQFDSAPRVFEHSVSLFQDFRDFGQVPEYKLQYLLATRRPIQEIEQKMPGTSTFTGTLDELPVGMFNDAEAEQLFARLETLDILLSDSDKQTLKSTIGYHPYLLGIVCREIVEQVHERGNFDLERIIGMDGKATTILDHYEDIHRWLGDFGMDSKILEIVFGPQITVLPGDAENLKRYGLVKVNSDNRYIPFSKHYGNFLSYQTHTSPLWEHWGETERTLRNWIDTILRAKYRTPDWDDSITVGSTNKDLCERIQKCRTERNNASKRYAQPSPRVIDYTSSPRDFWVIIDTLWKDTFKQKLGGDYQDWSMKFELLRKVRNAMAHNSPNPTEEEKKMASLYCEEILKRIKPQI